MTLEYIRDEYGSLKLLMSSRLQGMFIDKTMFIDETRRGGNLGSTSKITEIRTEIDEIRGVGRGRSEVGSLEGRGQAEVAHLAGSRHLARGSGRGAVLQYAH